MNEMSATVESNTQTAAEADKLSLTASDAAEKGSNAMKCVVGDHAGNHRQLAENCDHHQCH